MSTEILRAMNDIDESYLEETAGRLGYTESAPPRPRKKRTVRTVLLIAAAAALLSISGAALSDWFVKTYILLDSPELEPMAQQAIEDASRFVDTDPDSAYISQVILYENGDQGQSGVYTFSTSAQISYYETGEIQALDARDHGVENPTGIQTWTDPFENLFADETEMAAYVEKVESMAGEVLDALHADGWVSGTSEGIAKVWCNDVYGTDTIFNDPSAVVSVLMADDSAYELWLDPQTLECEGFMFWKSEDMPNTRNGRFLAMKEGNMEQWQHEVSNNPYALG